MNRRHVVTISVLLACVALGWEIGGADRFGKRSFEAVEVARLRLHFAEVEREMLSRDISDLTPARRAARAEQIRQLRRYSGQGAFPRNTYHPGKRTPYFRDASGNLCAMAFLIAASGRGDIVDHIARTRNYAFVPDLVDVPGLAEWLVEHGLTVAEAARIQPAYDGPGFPGYSPPKPSAGYWAASAGASALSGLSIAWNARSLDRLPSQRGRGAFGLGVGAVTLAMGVVKLNEEGRSNRRLGAWNAGVGALAAVLGLRALTEGPRDSKPESRFRVVPVASAGDGPDIGFQGRLRF